jgi:hypothetical protein
MMNRKRKEAMSENTRRVSRTEGNVDSIHDASLLIQVKLNSTRVLSVIQGSS